MGFGIKTLLMTSPEGQNILYAYACNDLVDKAKCSHSNEGQNLADALTGLDIVNLVASATSILLAVLAIVLAILFFIKAKDSETRTEVAINKIDSATNTLSTLSMRLINRLTSALTSPRAADEKILEALNAGMGGVPKTSEDVGDSTSEELEQYRVDNLIAALYYCAFTNASLQLQLPPSIGETQDNPTANFVDQSYGDFATLKAWLTNTKNSKRKIEKSPVKHLYDQAMSLEPFVSSVRDFYAKAETGKNTTPAN